MLSNLHYFDLSIKNKEPLIDLDYRGFVNHPVIPIISTEKNELTKANQRIIDNINAIGVLIEANFDFNNPRIKRMVKIIDKELQTTEINYSAFCQYFNVHNINYSIYKKLNQKERIGTLTLLIEQFLQDRYAMYNSHGYSNIVLQAFSDSYSHKRKGEYGINKIIKVMVANNIPNLISLENKSFTENDMFYLLSDKNGKSLFSEFAKTYKIPLSKKGKNVTKYPDALIKIHNHFFVVEQKNLKENGGGQDKQALEVLNFIDRKPKVDGVHFIGFIDGIYFNQINKKATGKVLELYHDVRKTLKKYKANYFINTFGFNSVIKDYCNQE